MKIETNDLIIRSFELRDENDLCKYAVEYRNRIIEKVLRAVPNECLVWPSL